MRKERQITMCGQIHTVVISDEQEALQAADAAGRAIVGIWDRTAKGQDLSPAAFVVENLADADDQYLEQVVRRRLGMPWIIGETSRLVIREFTLEDLPAVMKEEGDREADQVFYTAGRLQEYIKNQYGFYQYGLWALVEKESGAIIGKAGVQNGDPEALAGDELAGWEGTPCLELGYHVFEPYRKKGYAREACREIQRYAKERLDCALYAKIDPSNEASIRVAEACGFRFITKRCSEAMQCHSLYVWNC